MTAVLGLTFWNNSTMLAFYGHVGHAFQVDNMGDRGARTIGRMELTCTNAVNLAGEIKPEVQARFSTWLFPNFLLPSYLLNTAGA